MSFGIENITFTDFLTLILAIATLSLAVSTYSLVKVTKGTFDLERRPYLVFENLFVVMFDGNNIQIALVLKNFCKVPICYEVKNISCTIGNKSVENPKFLNRGSTIFPNNIRHFNYDIIQGISIEKNRSLSGIMEYKINYFNSDDMKPLKYFTFKRIRFFLSFELEKKEATVNTIFEKEEDGIIPCKEN